MAERRYEISLRVLKNISRVSADYINTNEIQNHFSSTFFFPGKGAIYYVAIATVIFSHVKDIMFPRESSPGISLVFI